jgi:hypothetical protein
VEIASSRRASRNDGSCEAEEILRMRFVDDRERDGIASSFLLAMTEWSGSWLDGDRNAVSEIFYTFVLNFP